MIYVCIIFVDGAAVRFPNRLVAVLLSSVLLLGAPMVSIADNGTTDGVQTAGSESPVPGDSGNAGAAVGSNGSGCVGDGASEGAETNEPSSVDGDGSNMGIPDDKETEGEPSGDSSDQGEDEEEAAPTLSPIDQLAKDHAADVADGVYCISSSLNRWSVIDISGGSRKSGSNAQLYRLNASKAQIWKIRHEGDFVVIENVGSGKVLDVAGGRSAARANVQQYAWNGTRAQLWVAINDGGSVKFVSALNESLVLDLSGASTSNGANIQLYSDNGSAAQRWALTTIPSRGVSPVVDEAAQYKDALADGDYYLVCGVGSKLVLDVAGGSRSNSANVQSYKSNGTAAQKWRITHDEQGFLTITNVGSGKVLDVSGGLFVPGANVQQYGANGSLAQKWYAVPLDAGNPNGGFTIHSALYPQLVLDVKSGSASNGANIQVYSSNKSAAQRFTFLNLNPHVDPCEQVMPEGLYVIHPSASATTAFDVASGSSANGTNIRLWASNNTLAQYFSFEFVDGYYVIRNAKTDKVLDVAGGGMFPGTNVQQWGYYAGGANQLWCVVANADGTYSFINKRTGLALDLSGGGSSRGTNVQVYTPNGSHAQCFSIQKAVHLLPEGIVSVSPFSSSKMVLDVASGSSKPGANVQLYAKNGTFAQKWKATLVDADNAVYSFESLCSGLMLASSDNGNVCVQSPVQGDPAQLWAASVVHGSIVLKNQKTGKALGVANGSYSNGSNIQTNDFNGSGAQSFAVSSVDVLNNGCYEIAFGNTSGPRLDVSGASFKDGANVQAYANNNTGAQKWNISKSGGAYKIVNAESGKALDAASGVISQGTNIRQWAPNGSAAQRWNIAYIGNGRLAIVSASNSSLAVGCATKSVGSGSNCQLVAMSENSSYAVSFVATSYSGGSILGVPRAKFVRWLESHRYDGYYIGTPYNTTLSINNCTYPNGARRSDGFAGMNCGGFVGHAYAAAGGNIWAINANNNHSPWAGGPGRGGYVNAWRWYGYAVDTGHVAYRFNSVSALLRSGVARKGDLIFFKTQPSTDCHIGIFWGDSPSDNKLWSSLSPRNTIGPIFNLDNPREINQQIVVIR